MSDTDKENYFPMSDEPGASSSGDARSGALTPGGGADTAAAAAALSLMSTSAPGSNSRKRRKSAPDCQMCPVHKNSIEKQKRRYEKLKTKVLAMEAAHKATVDSLNR